MGNTLESITLCDREWRTLCSCCITREQGNIIVFFFLSKCAAILLASLDPERFHHISLGHNRNCMFPQNVILLICDATRQLTNKSYLIDDWTILRPCKMRTNWRSNIWRNTQMVASERECKNKTTTTAVALINMSNWNTQCLPRKQRSVPYNRFLCGERALKLMYWADGTT